MPSDIFLVQETESDEEEKCYEKLTSELISSPKFQQKIHDIIFTLIPEVPRLSDLFINWECLTNEERNTAENVAQLTTQPFYRELYKPFVNALKNWEKIQDTQGAPGIEPGIVNLSRYPQIEVALSKVINPMESMLWGMQGYKGVCQYGSSNPFRCLFEDENNRYSLLDGQSFKLRKSLSLDGIPKTVGRKSTLSI